uniref:Uncharacterized protein n=1 Tax=Caenorhabditis japonica TaxID=281687 RepID=A0A8R1DNT2_CAEJA
MPFREFSDSDLDSYLEGSVWSEKPSASEIFTDQTGKVITVFPKASHSNMVYGYPANHCETVFPAEKNEPVIEVERRKWDSFYENFGQ